MTTISFLSQFKKDISKLANVSTDFSPPTHWYDSGNYAVNKILSGNPFKGIPQSRVTVIAGPSDSGKSFLLSNIMKSAQIDDDAFILAIDSENALDIGYLTRIGVSTDPTKFMGISVTTINDTVKVISEFIMGYEKSYGKRNPAAPKVLIAVDSLDMLLTETELAHFESGDQKGDQGQRAKQLKAFLRTVVGKIKSLNISFIGTHQVYPADVMKGEGLWSINNAIRYSASQIILVTKLKLREGDDVIGIRMKVETFKSRFAKLGSKVTVEVPYATGMNRYSGLLELLEGYQVVTNNRGWYTFNDAGNEVKFQESKLNDDLVKKLFTHPNIRKEIDVFEEGQNLPELEEIPPGEPNEA